MAKSAEGNYTDQVRKDTMIMNTQIKCPRCGSSSFKKEESKQDFASIKREGESAKKFSEKLLQGYFCWDCSLRWYKPNELLTVDNN